MPFYDDPEVKLIQRTIRTHAEELYLASDIKPEDFKDPHRGKIWEVILETQKVNWNPYLDLFSPEAIERLGGKESRAFSDLNAIDGLEEVHGLTQYYAEQVRQGAKDHKKLLLQDLLTKPVLHDKDLAEADRLLSEIKKPLEPQRETTPLEDKLNWIDSLQTPEKVIPTNFPSIDEFIGGFRPSSYYLLAGRTGNGKTSVALNLATNIRNAKVVFYSLEMPLKFIHARLSTIQTGIENPISDEPRQPEDLSELAASYAVETLDNIKFVGTPEGGLTIGKLLADIKARVRNRSCEIVFIDQLDNIASDGKFYSSTTDRISDYSAQIRQLAKDLDIPIVLLVQINRDGNDEPQLVHLKQSGQLEQDAAVAFIVQRKDPDAEDSELVFKVAKNRYGRTGKTFFNWKGKLQRIEEKPNLMPTYNPANFTRKTSDTSKTTF